jgi:hypothetical protein
VAANAPPPKDVKPASGLRLDRPAIKNGGQRFSRRPPLVLFSTQPFKRRQ